LPGSKFAHEAIAVGGTFEALHVGHERLLSKAFSLGRVVFIGVSGDKLAAGLGKTHRVRSFPARKQGLVKFLKSHGWLERARIVELKDPFGPAVMRKNLEALVVSEETRENGMKVNTLRQLLGLPPVRLYIVRLVKADDGIPVSATRILRGEINAQGKSPSTPKQRRRRNVSLLGAP
jgi:pantetheine-phosphate adenylyltransferase